MNKEFVPYEQSLALKKLGFDEPCLAHYTKDKKFFMFEIQFNTRNSDVNENLKRVSAPTFSQAFRWFREKYELEGDISHLNDGKFKWSYQIKNITNNPELSKIISSQPYFESNEEAELACLIKLIEIVKR